MARLVDVEDLFGGERIEQLLVRRLTPVETLVETTERLIDLFAPRLVLGISDEISSTGDIERLRMVAEVVDRYHAGLA